MMTSSPSAPRGANDPFLTPIRSSRPRKPSACVRLGEKRERPIVFSSRRIGLSIWARVPSLPTSGGQLPQAPPRFPLRRTHDALPCTRMDANGRSCHSVPLPPCADEHPHDSADITGLTVPPMARSGTDLVPCRTQISVGTLPRFRREGARVPSACHSEWVFLVISVLLCHRTESTKKARTREISRIRAFDGSSRMGV